MKTLYLMRHAKSDWSDPSLSDYNRPLKKRGEKNAPEMGERMKERNVLPDLVISSGANRAFTTAKVVSDSIGYNTKSIVKNDELYFASVHEIVEIVKGTDDSVSSLMLFGHNPGFTDTSNFLVDAFIDNIPTAGYVKIEFEVNNWGEIDQHKGRLIQFDYPKNKS